MQAIEATLQDTTKAAGYANACGTVAAREAVAAFHGAASSEDVILANGCSGALELALTALLDTDSVLLVPQPGFPLYQVIAESHGASVAHYRLHTDDWSVNVEHVRSLLIEHPNAAAMVVNNPSNPTGAVYNEEQLRAICSVCQEFHVPIVADEIYGDMVFGNQSSFLPIASIASEYQVPVITASGIGKQFLLPGWRVGWIVVSDNTFGSLQHVWAGAKRLAQVVLGASHLAQTAVPALLALDDPHITEWKNDLRGQLQTQAAALCTKLRGGAPGLRIIEASGAMYALVQIDNTRLHVKDDVDFANRLLQEEAVFVLPGACFGIPQAFRVVFCASVPVLEEAARRICRFCQRHEINNIE